MLVRGSYRLALVHDIYLGSFGIETHRARRFSTSSISGPRTEGQAAEIAQRRQHVISFDIRTLPCQSIRCVTHSPTAHCHHSGTSGIPGVLGSDDPKFADSHKLAARVDNEVTSSFLRGANTGKGERPYVEGAVQARFAGNGLRLSLTESRGFQWTSHSVVLRRKLATRHIRTKESENMPSMRVQTI
ncbi:uncharacterized protein PAC_10225 [Phialocephala subalpina]|uniref:Uncharacterized protein n=1 Tax=Phialocephala subalpina TaxID=576137 RepID=A0A1L7X5N5_9HELO|nr:uncharacterized protein PAC_10225 [Phialocephala subalpina]